VRTTARRVLQWLCDLPGLRQDALLYALSALFAVGVLIANTGDYHQWGEMAAGPYALGAIACEAMWLVYRRRQQRDSTAAPLALAEVAPQAPSANGSTVTQLADGSSGAPHTTEAPSAPRPSVAWVNRGRVAVVLVVMAFSVVAPLSAELIWRAEGAPGVHAQPEVRVIEAAGDRAANHQDPYLRDPRNYGSSPTNDAKNVDVDSFFPYLPGMTAFGLTNSLSGPKILTDARVPLTGFTLIVVVGALLLYKGPRRKRGRAFQVLIVLPTGALPIVTGGDDLPVLALMLLGLVLAQRRQPVLSGLAMGINGVLKFTAWPLLLLLALGQRDRAGRQAIVRYALSVLVIVVPIIGIGFALDPKSFILNVVRFPLGLAQVKSPAASPMLGQTLVTVFPHAKVEITLALLVIGGAAFLWFLWRHTPTTPSSAARFTGWALLVATFIAPATRFGYLIYPANLLVWAYMLDGAPVPGEAGAAGTADQESSPTWRRASSRRLVGAV
jgi:Glycosyltransferase family 87